jgi:uncharacterized protein YciI
MIVAYICTDRGDQTETRRRLLLDHLRYVETVADKILVGGPVPPTEPGDTRQFKGSILLYKVGRPEEAAALFNGDPYAKAGIWEKVEVLPFEPALGEVVGGITWQIVDGQIRPKAAR